MTTARSCTSGVEENTGRLQRRIAGGGGACMAEGEGGGF